MRANILTSATHENRNTSKGLPSNKCHCPHQHRAFFEALEVLLSVKLGFDLHQTEIGKEALALIYI